jgi:hypothetical protein
MARKTTIIIKTVPDLDCFALNALMDQLQSVTGVFSVSLPEHPVDPTQLNLFDGTAWDDLPPLTDGKYAVPVPEWVERDLRKASR